ncbi:MAG: cation:proton antiporter [Gemmatimonadota bacterium]
MFDFPVLRDLGFVIAGAAVLLFLTRPLRVPPIVAYMLGGLLLGPLTGALTVSESLELISELGIALLLFVVGLELSLEKIRDVGRPALIGGTLAVALKFAVGAGIASVLGFPATEAAFLGLATAFSSTVVVVKLLDRAGQLDAVYGRISIGMLLVEDVLVAAALTLVSGLGAGGSGGGLGAVARGLLTAFLGIAALAAVAGVAVRSVLPRLFAWLRESTEALFIASLAWAFAFILAAEALHVSIELGAFIAGVALAQLPHNEALRRRIHPLVDFFLAVFFVALGAGIDLPAVSTLWWPALVLSVYVLVGRPILVAFVLGRLGRSPRTAVLAGLTLSQVSEFALILVALAVTTGLVRPEILSLVGLLALTTIGASAALVPHGHAVHDALHRRGLLGFLGTAPAEEAPPAPRAGHVIVAGMNTLGRRLVEAFAARGERVLAIDTDPRKLSGLPAETLLGSVDGPAVLEEAEIERARLVVSALQIEGVNALLAYRCAELGVPVSIHAFDPSLADELLEIGADHLMISKHDGIRQIEDELRRIGVIV